MMNKLLKNAFANKKFKYIIIIGIVGFALILMSNFNTNKTENNVVDDYAEKTEEKIGHIVCRITGEKSVAVMVSLESNGEIVYADAKNVTKNNKTDSQSSGEYRSEQSVDSEQKYIIVEKCQGGEEALVVTKIRAAEKISAALCHFFKLLKLIFSVFSQRNFTFELFVQV